MALSFQSLFSTLPVMVIGLTLLTQFISRQEVSEIADWLSQHMLQAQAQEVAPEIRLIANSVDVGTLGIVGVLGLIFVAATLFWTLTHIVDDIWRVRKKPPLAYRALSAVVILLLLPTFSGLSVIVSQLYSQLPWSADFFVPVAVNVAGLYLAYRYVPSTTIDGRAALASALLMGIVLEAGKLMFSFYVVRLSVTIQGLYGAIAFIPLTLFWLYLLWLIFLFGVELTFTLQNLPELWLQDHLAESGAFGQRESGSLALRVAQRVYRTEGVTLSELSRQLKASPRVVRKVIERLGSGGLVESHESGDVTPTRLAKEVAVVDVLALFGATHVESQSGDERLEEIIKRLESTRDQAVDGVTLKDLLK